MRALADTNNKLQLIGHAQVQVPALLMNQITKISTVRSVYNGYPREMARWPLIVRQGDRLNSGFLFKNQLEVDEKRFYVKIIILWL